jgi:hypothetical protein
MSSERQESRGPLGLIASLRGRIARYREQADHFKRLAEAERSKRSAINGRPWRVTTHI